MCGAVAGESGVASGAIFAWDMRKLGWRKGERINPPLHDSWFPISPLGALVSPPRAGPHPAFLRVQWQSHCRGEKILTL